jgi:hypothetical protein
MGIYYTTYLFKGQLVFSGDDIQERYKTSKKLVLNSTAEIVYDNIIKLGSLDHVIDDEEREQGYIDYKEITYMFENYEKFGERWGTPTDKEDIYIVE